MKLNKEQKAYLESLVCQRVGDDDENKELIKRFVNAQNPGLAGSLKRGGKKDKKEKLAYYIVKDPELEVPMLFFSLKCGEVSVPYDPKRMDEILKNSEMLYAAAKGRDADDWAKEIVEKMKQSGIPAEDIVNEFKARYDKNVRRKNLFAFETIAEGDNIIRVLDSHPAVELVHFCAYDPIDRRYIPFYMAKEQKKQLMIQHNPVLKRWNAKGMGNQPLGKTMFWQFIVPIIQDVRDLVGCEYVYLFAADEDKYGTLVEYYEDLGFEIRKDLSVSKPEYDFACYFMCQKVKSLRNRKNTFFRNYNPDEN